jgi:hypothetical protein
VSTEGQLLNLLQRIDRTLLEFKNGGALKANYRDAYGGLARAVGNGTPGVYSVFGRSTVGRLRSARAAFVRGARDNFGPGFSEWADRFGDAGNGLRAQMKRHLIRAQLEGWDQRTLAENLIRTPEFSFKNLPKVSTRGQNVLTMGGKLSPSDVLVRRANMIARTELAAVEERMHENWAQEAGFTRAINVNSDPVAQVCKDANAAGAMTFDEWARSPYGKPPRHPRCDSLLMAVGDEYAAEADRMAKAA